MFTAKTNIYNSVHNINYRRFFSDAQFSVIYIGLKCILYRNPWYMIVQIPHVLSSVSLSLFSYYKGLFTVNESERERDFV